MARQPNASPSRLLQLAGVPDLQLPRHECRVCREDSGGRTRDLACGMCDQFLESYVSWREEAATVQTAYDQWQAGEALAFAAYRAALDREEQAAKALCQSAERISCGSG